MRLALTLRGRRSVAGNQITQDPQNQSAERDCHSTLIPNCSASFSIAIQIVNPNSHVAIEEYFAAFQDAEIIESGGIFGEILVAIDGNHGKS
jgi:hypothetical protein